jgi:hypothetical protein
MTDRQSTNENVDIPEIGIDYNPPSNFRLNNQKLLLTYATHIPKLGFKNWFGENIQQFKRMEIAHETGMANEEPFPHSHVLIDFGHPFQTRDARRFDFNSIHPHIKKICSRTHWINSLNYLAKEDPDNAHLKTDTNIVSSIWAAGSLQDALVKHVHKPGDAIGIKAIYDTKPKNDIIVTAPTAPWQIALIEELKQTPDIRKIIWYFDEIGNTGKSYICRYLVSSNPTDYYCVTQTCGMYHFGTIIQGAVQKGWSGHCLLLDLARNAETKQIYEPMENIKNGMITAVKYMGGTVTLSPPHVVVFANFLPTINSMSRDRWLPGIREIYQDGTIDILNPDVVAIRNSNVPPITLSF